MDKSVYCTVRWSNHSNNVNRFLSVNYAEEKYTDVALACDGHILKAHKMILAGCSPYFEDLFSMYSVPNLCVAIEGIAYPILQLVLEFMYSGEIRVKHAELENLVKAGVQLKVKGLDAIKLNDLARGAERTTVIARPTDGNPSQKVKLTRPTASVSKPTPNPPDSSSPPKKIEPPQVPLERLKPVPKPSMHFGQKPGATSTPLPKPRKETVKPVEDWKLMDSPSKLKLNSEDKKEPSPVPSPSKPKTMASESKRKVGEWLDSLDQTETNLENEESEPESRPRQAKKRVTKPRAPRLVKGPKLPRAAKKVGGTNGVDDEEPQEELITEKEEEAESGPETMPEKAVSPLKETPVKNNPEPDTKSAEIKDVPAVPTRLKDDEAIDSEEPKKEKEEEETVQAPKKKEEVTTTRSRTIKKPARMADWEFEFDTEVVSKKRRGRKADEAEIDSADGDPAAAQPEVQSPPKRRKGGFVAFCADFRAKIQEENPGENRKEIQRRLALLWQNLDQTTKNKYHDADSKPKKDK